MEKPIPPTRQGFINISSLPPNPAGLEFILNLTKRVKELNSEMKQFNDFVIGDYIDSYRNLTLKTFSGYRYIHDYCHTMNGNTKEKWVLMQDDDTLIDEHRFSYLIDDLDNDKINKGSGFESDDSIFRTIAS